MRAAVAAAALILSGCGAASAPSAVGGIPSTPAQKPASCAPSPCAAGGGVTVHLTRVVSPYTPSPRAGAPTLDPLTHLVLVEVAVQADAALVLPPTAFVLQAPGGQPLPVDLVEGGEECEGAAGGATVTPGVTAVPLGMCFDIGAASPGDFALSVTLPTGRQLEISLSRAGP